MTEDHCYEVVQSSVALLQFREVVERAGGPGVIYDCGRGMQDYPSALSNRDAKLNMRALKISASWLSTVTDMDFMDIDGAKIAFRVTGSGPALLAPECNYTWFPELVELMARRFTVIIASPRDFGASTRTHGPYNPDRWANDLRQVALNLGFPRFLFFGYSFTGAFGPWLAQRLAEHGSVVAVAAGGFPLLGDYGITSRDVDYHRIPATSRIKGKQKLRRVARS